jgi:ADP-ribose pyrophosphatase
MKLWKTLRRRNILNRGWRLQVEEHAVELHNGRVIEDWTWVITPPYANVVVVTTSGEFVVFRQTKYSVGHTLAAVGGHIEPDEDHMLAAKRELLEETGYTAPDDQWRFMGTYAVDANRGCGTASLYLVTGATYVGGEIADDLEEQELVLMSRGEVERALARAEFKVLPWATALALGLLWLDGRLRDK